jgi:hypothetical protein
MAMSLQPLYGTRQCRTCSNGTRPLRAFKKSAGHFCERRPLRVENIFAESVGARVLAESMSATRY